MKSSQIKSAVMILMNFLKHHLRTKNKWQIIDPHVNSNCWYLIPINYYLTTATGSLRSKNPNNPWRYIPHLTPRSARAEVGRVERSAICETVNLGDVFCRTVRFPAGNLLCYIWILPPKMKRIFFPTITTSPSLPAFEGRVFLRQCPSRTYLHGYVPGIPKSARQRQQGVMCFWEVDDSNHKSILQKQLR